MVAAFLLLAMASHVTRMQTMVVVAQMREGRRRELLVQLLMSSNMPLTTQTRRKVERSPNGWRSSTMYGYVYGKDGVRNSDSVFKSNFRMSVMAGGKTDTEIWAEFYGANEPDLCPSCRRRNALHCVHMAEYQADVNRGRVGATRRTRDVLQQRNYLRDKFWRRLVGAAPDHTYSDASDDEEQTMAEALDRLLANNADRANLAELQGVVDKAHYNLMVTRALRAEWEPSFW